MEHVLLPVRLVRYAHVVVEATDDLHLIRFEGRLHPEGASCPPLAGKAVADRDERRIAFDVQTQLPTMTGGLSSGHRRKTYGIVFADSSAAL